MSRGIIRTRAATAPGPQPTRCYGGHTWISNGQMRFFFLNQNTPTCSCHGFQVIFHLEEDGLGQHTPKQSLED